MRPKNIPGDQQNRTFIEAARRAQIIKCAIDVIADLGYAQASLAQIAKCAGISKGVISYHFANKDELMSEVIHNVLAEFAAFVGQRLEQEHTAAGTLRAFIETSLAFMNTHRKALLAMFDIIDNARTEDGKPFVDNAITQADIANLEQVLLQGQQQGEFREFDAHMMAVSIMSLRNGVIGQLAINPDFDLNAYTHELVTLVELATRRTE